MSSVLKRPTETMHGTLIGADFPADTITLEMEPGYYTAKMRFSVVPADEYIRQSEQRAELLEALRKAESRLRRLSEFDCGCRPCHGSCRTGRGAEIELEGRMETAAEYADETLKDIANATQQRKEPGA